MDVRRAFEAHTGVGESPVWPAAALIAAAVLYADLPTRFISGPGGGSFHVIRWIVPGLTLLVVASLGLMPVYGRITRRHLIIGTIALVSVANAASIILLIHALLHSTSTNAPQLLRVAVHMWLVNVLLFGLWYWQHDGGGPLARPSCPPARRDFLFPQQLEPIFADSGWSPKFVDYLYVSFTNSTAFSPTDTMPLSRWAKMLMVVQSAISLALAVMVVARAVTVLT
ncbi:MAG: hypothetical protein QOG85_379 [Gaiellaceae bacterium]|jgi:hypothetical protein|nr:hypothetical protein [Gaiellaceae bacterium]